MFNQKKQSGFGLQAHKAKRMQTLAVILLVILLVSAPIFVINKIKSRTGSEKKEILQVWEEGNYAEAYAISKNALLSKPMDYFFLTINGFSAFQLGISQINSQSTLVYIDECIQSLRKAILLKDAEKDGRVYYVLGKAYCYKGDEYADLAIKYLETARDLSYNADDMGEYLGLAYAAAGDFRSSVEAFTQALAISNKITDSLLLSIARSYIALEEYDISKAYLIRCVDSSADSKSILTAKFLLADVYVRLGDRSAAEDLYLGILNETGENAEAHFQLGELYAMQGDTTRARWEWRQAYRIDPAHTRARARLNI
jgi:tetratricopeptide (TPR) repeat protein